MQTMQLHAAIRAAILASLAMPIGGILAGETSLISVTSDGVQAEPECFYDIYSNWCFGSYHTSISADGMLVAFESRSTNLVQEGDNNGFADIFVHDRRTHQTIRVSVASDGSEAENPCGFAIYGYSECFGNSSPSLSGDGRHVAFVSPAPNLVANDTNNSNDVFIHNLETHQTKRVSVRTAGVQGNGESQQPDLSSDGNIVAFTSTAGNLVDGDSNGVDDVFVHDLAKNETSRVSVSSKGKQGSAASRNPSVSADGRFVAFSSYADNLVAGDTNKVEDVFLHDRVLHQTMVVSQGLNGAVSNSTSSNPRISSDGRYVTFVSAASNLVEGDTPNSYDIYVYDRVKQTTERINHGYDGSLANAWADLPDISANGRYVTYVSGATNLIHFDINRRNDIFLYDRQQHRTTRVNLAYDNSPAKQYCYIEYTDYGDGNIYKNKICKGDSDSPSIDAEGRRVAFASDAVNLIQGGDSNGVKDVFIRDRLLDNASSGDLEVTQMVSANPVKEGNMFGFTVIVKNLGDTDVSQIKLIDALPQQGVTLLSLVSNQGSCIRGALAQCNLGNLAAGQTAFLIAKFKALQKTDEVRNSVSVGALEVDPIPINNYVSTIAKVVAP